MAKFNVGDKVRVLNADEIIGGIEHWNNGDIVTVTDIDDNRTWLTRTKTEETFRHPFLHEYELQYVELVARKPRKSERISALETEVARQREVIAELTAKVGALEIAKEPFSITKTRVLETPNQLRWGTIQRAKAFVERKMIEVERSDVLSVEFVVNSEKRTVVALLHGLLTKEIRRKGIAKCDPDDVFNVDIGKAIALARALGVDVPEEFVKAVQPNASVGQRIRLKHCGFITAKAYHLSKVDSQVARGIAWISEDTDAVYA